jgi:hypothetical protein
MIFYHVILRVRRQIKRPDKAKLTLGTRATRTTYSNSYDCLEICPGFHPITIVKHPGPWLKRDAAELVARFTERRK